MSHGRAARRSTVRGGLAVAGLAALLYVLARPLEAVPTLVLSPAGGPAPTVNGALSGPGWCSTGLVRGVTVTGPGVTGSASVARGGELAGSFAVTGSPGQLVTITVTVSCSTGTEVARANFRFNDPTPPPTSPPTPPPSPTPTPPPSPTATASPTPTPVATASAAPTPVTPPPTATSSPRPAITPGPTSTAGPTPGGTPAPEPSRRRVRVVGCPLPAEGIRLRISMAASTQSDASWEIAAARGQDPQVLEFELPPALATSGLLALHLLLDDARCPTSERPLYIDGHGATELAPIVYGATTLEASTLGAVAPAGGFGAWVQQLEFGGALATRNQLLRWDTSAAGADGAIWQVTLNPIDWPEGTPPPGDLLGFGTVSCVCSWTLPFEGFAPKTPPAPTWSAQLTEAAFTLVQMLQQAPSAVGASAGTSTGVSPPASVTSIQPVPLVAGDSSPVLPVPLDFYVRVVPTAGGVPAGPPSNVVRLRWTGDSGVIDLSSVPIVDCVVQFEDPYCKALGYGPPPPKAYTVEILEYHGWIEAVEEHAGCYLVTQDTTVKGLVTLEYKAGAQICEPEPEEESWLEAVVDFVTGAIDWASTAYADLKAEVVSFVASAMPPGLCDESCVGTLLDAGLVALGIPPDIPNFDQLTDQGLDYLAERAVSEAGVPAALQDEVKKQFKAGVQAGLKEMEQAYADKVPWLPAGVPVKPHPLGARQPPYALLRVTHLAGPTTSCLVNLDVRSSVIPSPAGDLEAAKYIPYYQGQYKGGTLPLYEPAHLVLPPIAPGQSLQIPLVLPQPWLSLGHAGAAYYSYDDAVEGWAAYYVGGSVRLRADVGGTCSAPASDIVVTPASSSFAK